MAESQDMSTPVTRGELRSEIARLEQRFDTFEQRLEQTIEEKLEQKLEEKLEEKLEQKLEQKLQPFRAEMRDEFARHARAMEETFRRYFGALDDKLTAMCERIDRKHDVANDDLDRRVTRLEAAVFPPPPKRRRRS